MLVKEIPEKRIILGKDTEGAGPLSVSSETFSEVSEMT